MEEQKYEDVSTALESLEKILVTEENFKSPRLPLHSFLTPSRPVRLTVEEIFTRSSFAYLDGRRWGLARRERENLLKVSQKKDQPLTPIYLLECISDIFEGKIQRAANAYIRAAAETNFTNYVLDFYIMREIITYLDIDFAPSLYQAYESVGVNNVSWFFSPIANALYRSKIETSHFAINELGQIADSLINEPGTKRFIALFLRAIQGNRLLESGEYAWAERVLTYTIERTQNLMDFNQPLLRALERDLAIAQDGIAHLSFQ